MQRYIINGLIGEEKKILIISAIITYFRVAPRELHLVVNLETMWRTGSERKQAPTDRGVCGQIMITFLNRLRNQGRDA